MGKAAAFIFCENCRKTFEATDAVEALVPDRYRDGQTLQAWCCSDGCRNTLIARRIAELDDSPEA